MWDYLKKKKKTAHTLQINVQNCFVFCFLNHLIAGSTHPQRVQSRHTEYPEPVFLRREKRLTLRLIGIRWKKESSEGAPLRQTKLEPPQSLCKAISFKLQILAASVWSGLVWLHPLSPHLTGAAHGAQCGAPLGGHREMTLALLLAHWLKQAAPTNPGETVWSTVDKRSCESNSCCCCCCSGELKRSCLGNLKCLKTTKWVNLPLLPLPVGGPYL